MVHSISNPYHRHCYSCLTYAGTKADHYEALAECTDVKLVKPGFEPAAAMTVLRMGGVQFDSRPPGGARLSDTIQQLLSVTRHAAWCWPWIHEGDDVALGWTEPSLWWALPS